MAETPGASDPSMEDILASIRRILNEDDSGKPPAPPAAPSPPASDVLVLDPSMMVGEPAPEPEEAVAPASAATPEPSNAPEAASEAASRPAPAAVLGPPGLIGPETAASAASAVGALVQALIAERAAPVYRGGPTIEDVVREELRPMLKSWLDEHLPPLVERLVRAEIERVVGRAAF